MKRVRCLLALVLLSICFCGCGIKKETVDENYSEVSIEVEDGVVKLESAESIEFEFGNKKFSFDAEPSQGGFCTVFTLSDGNSKTEDELSCIRYKLYEVTKNNKGYLYLCITNEFAGCYIYVYDLNSEEIASPEQIEGKYALYSGEIDNIDSFELQEVNTFFGTNGAYKNFYVGDDGRPVSDDEYALFDYNCVNEPQEEHAGGVEIITMVDMECEIGESVTADKLEKGTIGMGSSLTYYRTDDKDVVDFVDANGRLIRFRVTTMTSDGNRVLNDTYTFSDFENVPFWG